MSQTIVRTRSSRLRFGAARVDITPPVGIYHRAWGAARHDRATGVHRPLVADVMIFAPLDGGAAPYVRAQLDVLGLNPAQHDDLLDLLGDACGVNPENVVVAFSQTHSSGWFLPDRASMPGGELIAPYMEALPAKLRSAARKAMESVREVTATYVDGRCNMAANRDYLDDSTGEYACGYNPASPADDTATVVRLTSTAGQLAGVLVSYACHPTTLAWENSLISPDYVGAMREVVEGVTGAQCTFMLGPSGDLGPRDGFSGETSLADKNGRQLGYAVLSTLESMGPPLADFAYQGSLISGATLGIWRYVPFGPERMAETALFSGGTYTVDLPIKPKPDEAELQAELESWETRQREADSRGDSLFARDCGARAERVRRNLGGLDTYPEASTVPLRYSVHRMGDAFWVSCTGEPYSLLQNTLRREFPDNAMVFADSSGPLSVGYVMPTSEYGKGLYQEAATMLGPGSIELLIAAMGNRIRETMR